MSPGSPSPDGSALWVPRGLAARGLAALLALGCSSEPDANASLVTTPSFVGVAADVVDSLDDVSKTPGPATDALAPDTLASDTLASDTLPPPVDAQAPGELPNLDVVSLGQGDGLDADVGALSVYPPSPPLACELSAPRRLFNSLWAAGAGQLVREEAGGGLLMPIGPALGGTVNPPTTTPGVLGAAEVWVSRYADQTCRVVALTSEGAELQAAEWPAEWCAAPVATSAGVAVPFNDASGGHVAWFGEALSSLAVVDVGAPITSPAALADAAIWLGSQGLLLRVTPTGVSDSVDTGLTLVGRVLPTDAQTLPALGWKGEPGQGLGDAIVRIRPGATGALEALAPITLEGPATSEPIVLADCTDPLANGSSHWWCPDGLVISAGDGWLAAHALQSGALYGQAAVEHTVTGLAAADNGLVYNGGSHWLGGWTLAVTDFLVPGDAPTQSLALKSDVDACVGSPMLDESGELTAIAAGELQRLPTASGELAAGWSRAGGSAEGNGVARGRAELCPASTARLLARDLVTPGENQQLARVAGRPEGGLCYGATASIAGGAPIDRVGCLNSAGDPLWSVDPIAGAPGTVALTQLAVGPGLVASAGSSDAGDVVVDVRNAADGSPRFTQTLPAFNDSLGAADSRLVGGMATVPGDRLALVGTRAKTTFAGWITILSTAGDTGAEPLLEGIFDISTTAAVRGLFIGPVRWYLFGSHNDFPGLGASLIYGIEPNTSSTSSFFAESPPAGESHRVQAMAATTTGLAVLEVRTGAQPGAYGALRRTTAELMPELPDLLFAQVGVDLTVADDGHVVVLLEDGSVATVDGAVAELSSGQAGNFKAVGLAADAGELMVGLTRVAAGALSFRRLDHFGHDGCSAAGRCASVACNDHNPCTVDSCEPATGACVYTPRLDGTACEAAGTCQGGNCL